MFVQAIWFWKRPSTRPVTKSNFIFQGCGKLDLAKSVFGGEGLLFYESDQLTDCVI